MSNCFEMIDSNRDQSNLPPVETGCSRNESNTWANHGPDHGGTYALSGPQCIHDDVIKWMHFWRYWSFVRGIHRPPVKSPHKGQWRGALMFPLICAWINGWVNNRYAGDLRHHHAHYDITIMLLAFCSVWFTASNCIKGQWRGALMFSFICTWLSGWVKNGEAGDLRRHCAYDDVIVMFSVQFLHMATRVKVREWPIRSTILLTIRSKPKPTKCRRVNVFLRWKWLMLYNIRYRYLHIY